MNNDRDYYVKCATRAQDLLEENPKHFKRNIRRQVWIAQLRIFSFFYIMLLLILIVPIAMVIAGVFASEDVAAGVISGGTVLFVVAIIYVWPTWKSMLAPPQFPLGVRVERHDAPKLYKLLTELRKELNCPPIHHCMISTELSASVYTRRLLFGFGVRRTFVCVGAGLLAGLSEEQLRSILAHEYGHPSLWSFKTHMKIARIHEIIQRREVTENQPLNPSIHRMATRLTAQDRAMMRDAEFEADQYAVRLTGEQVAGVALLRTELLSHYFGQVYWPELEKQAADRSVPPERIVTDQIEHLQRGEPEQNKKALRYLELSLQQTGTIDHTHPSTMERLVAMNWPQEQLTYAHIQTKLNLPENNAWQAWFEPGVPDRLLMQLNGLANAMVYGGWQQRHEQIQKVRDQLSDPLDIETCEDIETLIDHAQLVANVAGPQAAIPCVQRILHLEPEHAEAELIFAQALAEELDERCVEHYERAKKGEPDIAIAASQCLYNWYTLHGQTEEAEIQISQSFDVQEKIDKANLERQQLPRNMKLTPHGLSQRQVNRVAAILWRLPIVRGAHLVRREVTQLPNMPCFLLILDIKKPWHRYQSDRKLLGLCHFVASQLGTPVFRHSVYVLPAASHWDWLGKRVRKIEGSQIIAANRLD